MTTTTAAPSLLRLALRTDAAVSGLNGAGYLLLAGPLSDLLGLPVGPLRGLGVFLLVFAACVWLMAARPAGPAVLAVVVGNGLWAAGSLVVVATDTGTPTVVGAVWVVLQAVVVATFAGWQVLGLRAAGVSDRSVPSGRA